MDSPKINANNIIGDNYTHNILKKNIIPLSFRMTEDCPVMPVNIVDNDIFIILNTGFNPFSYKKTSSTTKFFFYKNYEFWNDLFFKKSYDFNNSYKEDSIHGEINMLLLEKDPEIVTIPIVRDGSKYYIPNPELMDEAIEEEDIRIVLSSFFIEQYFKLPVINYRLFQKINPTIIIPANWDFLNILGDEILPEKVRCPLNLKNKNLDVNLKLLVLILCNARSFKHRIFPNEDIFYLYFFSLEDLSFNENSELVLLKKIEKSYNRFVGYFFKNQYGLFFSQLVNEVTVFKIRNRIVTKEKPEFASIIEDIKDVKCLVSQTFYKNLKDDSILNQHVVCEIYENKFGFTQNDFIPKLGEVIYTRKEKKKNTLSIEEVNANMKKLLEEEEIERKIAEEKEIQKKKKREEQQYISKMKLLAKKIANEANEYVVKKEVKRRKEETKIKQTIIKQTEVKQTEVKLTEVKITNDTDDNLFCEIGSQEYERRTKESDIKKINPNIFCYPIDQVANFFNNPPQKDDDIWLFNLW